MEELNIEQKAKRYDEILARAKDANISHYKEDNVKEFADYLIPELKEDNDERIRKKLISYFSNVPGFSSLEYNYSITKEEVIAWLEKQGDHKPTEWSEENEQMINDIIEAIDKQYAVSDYQEMVTWLKSIKYRYTWKPSDEQMEALNDAISARDIKYDILSELWKNLKKLKED